MVLPIPAFGRRMAFVIQRFRHDIGISLTVFSSCISARWPITMEPLWTSQFQRHPFHPGIPPGHLTGVLLLTVGNSWPKMRPARSGIWLSCHNAGQRRKQKDFVILSAFSMCTTFKCHCCYIHCFVEAFECELSGMNNFIEINKLP